MMRLLKLYAVLCLIAFLGGILQPILTSSEVISVFTPKPEAFTELYFEDHLRLPVSIAPYSSYSFRFTIHNRTGQTQQYTYRVMAEQDKENVILDERMVIIDANEAQTIQESLTTEEEIPKKSRVVVSLLETNQHITFWMDADI